MTADLYDFAPPPIPDLVKLWAEYGQSGTSTTNGHSSVRTSASSVTAEGSKKDVLNKMKDVSIKDSPHSALLALKIAIFKDIILFDNDNGRDQYDEIMADLRSDRVEKFAVDHRLKRALQGKDAANNLLLPHHPDAYAPKPESGRDYRSEIGKAECALFSNIAAMALMLVKGSTMPAAQSDTLCQIGIDASEVCISLHEYISAATMAKSCRRAKELSEMVRSREIAPDRLRFFRQQEELLNGMEGEKLFCELPRAKHASPAKI